jgi:hypothetical protein
MPVGVYASQAPKPKPNLFDPRSNASSVTRAPAAPTSTGGRAAPPPQPAPVPAKVLGPLALDPATGGRFQSGDGSLEVDVPSGAVTAAEVAAAGGGMSLLVRQVAPASGSSAGGSGRYSFGTFLVQVLDARGNLVQHGLRQPLGLRLHTGTRSGAVDLAHVVAVINPPLPAGIDVGLPGGSGAPASRAPRPGSVARQRASLDQTSGTLAAMVPTSGPNTSFSFNTDAAVAAFGKPDPLVNPGWPASARGCQAVERADHQLDSRQNRRRLWVSFDLVPRGHSPSARPGGPAAGSLPSCSPSASRPDDHRRSPSRIM